MAIKGDDILRLARTGRFETDPDMQDIEDDGSGACGPACDNDVVGSFNLNDPYPTVPGARQNRRNAPDGSELRAKPADENYAACHRALRLVLGLFVRMIRK